MTRTSVIIPVRNGSRFIHEAINSALGQLASDDEILVIDDASTDATGQIVSKIDDRRVQLLAGSGRGVSSARNIGLATATGAFVAFLDHDDLWPPHRHQALLEPLLQDNSLDCVVGRLRLLMEEDAVMLPWLRDVDGQLAAKLSLCTALFRRRILDKVGTFDEDMGHGEDTDYFLRLQENYYRVLLCDVDGLIYRRHSTNATCDVVNAQDGFMQLLQRRRSRNAKRTSGS